MLVSPVHAEFSSSPSRRTGSRFAAKLDNIGRFGAGRRYMRGGVSRQRS